MGDTLSELRAEADALARRGHWGRYRNMRYTLAEGHRHAGRWDKAGPLYVEVVILDLQGAGHAGFRPTYATPAPAALHEAARFVQRRDLDSSGVRSLYTYVADRVWRSSFPRSQAEVWEEVRPVLERHRARLRLKRVVAHLGSEELLPDDEASTYRAVADDFALVRRVEQLLAPVELPMMPPARRSRAVSYLSGVDVAALTPRWRGKAARRTGELMWVLGARSEALDYLERARKTVDPVEQVAVKGLVRRLHRRLDGGNVKATGV